MIQKNADIISVIVTSSSFVEQVEKLCYTFLYMNSSAALCPI